MNLREKILEAFNDTVSTDPHTGNLCGREDFFNLLDGLLDNLVDEVDHEAANNAFYWGFEHEDFRHELGKILKGK